MRRTALSAAGDEPTDSRVQTPVTWKTPGLTVKNCLVSITSHFTVGTTQEYSFWHNSWKISVGRLFSFTSRLQLAHFQFFHGLGGAWEVHTGDFTGQGQAQILLYDPSRGGARMLVLKPDLSVTTQLDYTGWGAGQVLYVGHFGLPTLSVMLYDPQRAQSTFPAFDTSLAVSPQYSVPSWGPAKQILVGSFLDRALCLEQHTCAAGDDLLVLDHTTGLVQQYVFSFDNQFSVYDNRIQAFLREGIAATVQVLPVDASLFGLFDAVNTTIGNEELY